MNAQETRMPLADAPAVAPRGWRQRWLIAVGGCAIFLAIPVGGYLYQLWSTESALAAAIAEADQLDPRWRLADLVADRPTTPDEQNPALVVMKVTALLGPAGFTLGAKNEELFEETRSVQRLNEAQIMALRAALSQQAAALELARTLKDLRGEGRFPIKYTADFLSTNLTPLHDCRSVMYMLECDAKLRAEDEDLAGAMESCRAILSAARAIGREPMLISALVRFAGDAVTVNTLERVLAQGEAPAELLALQQLLAQETEAPVLLEALRGDRAGFDQLLGRLQEHKVSLSALIGTHIDPLNVQMLEWLPATVSAGRAEQLRLMTRAVEAVKLPVEQQGPAFAAGEEARLRSSATVVRLLMPAVIRVADANRRIQANLRRPGRACGRALPARAHALARFAGYAGPGRFSRARAARSLRRQAIALQSLSRRRCRLFGGHGRYRRRRPD